MQLFNANFLTKKYRPVAVLDLPRFIQLSKCRLINMLLQLRRNDNYSKL